MVQIIIVNGSPSSGKTTFEDLVIKHNKAYASKYSTIDIIKDAAIVLGWDGKKTPKNRKFLSDLKDLATKWDDVTFKSILKEQKRIQFRLDQHDMSDVKHLLMVDCREPEEIKKFKNAGAITLFISRTSVESNEQSNSSDSNVKNFEYDYYIENNGTLEELESKAIKFAEDIRGSI